MGAEARATLVGFFTPPQPHSPFARLESCPFPVPRCHHFDIPRFFLRMRVRVVLPFSPIVTQSANHEEGEEFTLACDSMSALHSSSFLTHGPSGIPDRALFKGETFAISSSPVVSRSLLRPRAPLPLCPAVVWGCGVPPQVEHDHLRSGLFFRFRTAPTAPQKTS